jgi:hypothetical protein
MCFSASASFIASGYLAFIGALCLKKNRNRNATFFAAIPLLFALQQASEGLLWLSFGHNWPLLQSIMPYIFLFFAFFLWPIWIPFSLTLLEPSQTRRHYLEMFLMVGILIGIYLYHFLIWHGVIAKPLSCHIYYDISIPDVQSTIDSIAYLLATVMPFFVSSMPIFWVFGLLLSGSYLITYFFYLHHLISLWCFFAALLSSFVYVIIAREQSSL